MRSRTVATVLSTRFVIGMVLAGAGAAGEDRVILAYGTIIRAAALGELERGQAGAFDEPMSRELALVAGRPSDP